MGVFFSFRQACRSDLFPGVAILKKHLVEAMGYFEDLPGKLPNHFDHVASQQPGIKDRGMFCRPRRPRPTNITNAFSPLLQGAPVLAKNEIPTALPWDQPPRPKRLAPSRSSVLNLLQSAAACSHRLLEIRRICQPCNASSQGHNATEK